jgi:phosphatidylinositol-bisphosphatase
VVSWNLAEKIPTDGEGAFIKALKDDDIVVLGSQECETVKFRRHEGHKSRAWHTMQRKALGKKYKNIASHSLGGIKLDVYVKSDLRKEVSVVKVMDVPCGIGNVIGNKGGICAVLKVRGSYLAVINSHLAAHQNKVKERNQDYERIVTTINARLREEVEGMNGRALKKRLAFRKQQQQQQNKYGDQDEDEEYQQQSRHVAQQPPIDPRAAARFDDRFDDVDTAVDAAFNELFDAVIFLGDFNYRLNVPRLEIELARLESEQQSGGPGGQSTHAGGEMEAIFEYVFCSIDVFFLPSFLVHDGLFVFFPLIHLLLPACIL